MNAESLTVRNSPFRPEHVASWGLKRLAEFAIPW